MAIKQLTSHSDRCTALGLSGGSRAFWGLVFLGIWRNSGSSVQGLDRFIPRMPLRVFTAGMKASRLSCESLLPEGPSIQMAASIDSGSFSWVSSQ